jgi:hypothetical protein
LEIFEQLESSQEGFSSMEVDVYNKNDTNVYHIATAGVE